ncbi:hypothetical protein KO481_25345 [Nocardia sp. NEAU-G5]|uniref:Serine/threonine protein kinase n=1 Tax=Nocardia albiluteola TaxID=2842303 RepID=A0ABS6B617_9NOCA|nr:hypothetical protein [Nocardia albiluteola]MBU3064841.1 hypothetical protein [Nocardia albiluteola]
MCSPSATLTVWAGAWLSGRSAPDDVLDALRAWAPRQLVAAGDPVTGGHTGLPWPGGESLDRSGAGIMPLLKLIREESHDPGARLRLVLPVPGDVRGLPAGCEFAVAAVEAEEGILVGTPGTDGTGLVPLWVDEETLQWTVYRTPLPATSEPDMPLGEAEYAMRQAVRDAADALMQLQRTGVNAGGADPRELIEDELAEYSRHEYPDSIPLRARRILDTADHVAAILTVAQHEPASAPTSASAMAAQETLLRPLWDAIRAARLAAVHAAS